MTRAWILFSLIVTTTACGGGTQSGDTGPDVPVNRDSTTGGDATLDTGATTDTGSTTDTGTANDTGAMTDTATSTDTGTSSDTGSSTDTGTGTDSGTTTDTGPRTDTGVVSCTPGLSCTGFPTSGYPTDATNVDNCAGMAHRTDCCGARRIFGINHGSRTTLCPAETACAAQYPSPASCMNTTITTDSGETTTALDQVRVRCVPMSGSTNCTCQTFVCTTSACMATSRIIGTCG